MQLFEYKGGSIASAEGGNAFGVRILVSKQHFNCSFDGRSTAFIYNVFSFVDGTTENYVLFAFFFLNKKDF